VNVVVAAHRQDHIDHSEVRPWFDDMTERRERFTVPAQVWGSFLRITTNRRIFAVPTPIGEAFDFIDATVAQPGHLLLGPGPRHLELLRQLCLESDAVGDLITDVLLAAIALEHGATVVTLDRDFSRFSSVPHLRPAAR
jgi:toxin-antitoxin system PIN domain toxin